MDDIKVIGSLDSPGSDRPGYVHKILLAFCDPEARAMARASLLDTGIQMDIDETETDEATLHALISRQYDCALVECIKGDGEQTILDLLAKARSQSPTTPVVAITDRLRDNDTHSLVASALDYLIKDHLTPYTLAQSVLRAIQYAKRRSVNFNANQQLVHERNDAIVARDAALEASRVKSQFLAFVTHELKTPLNSIMGYADLLDDELRDASIAHLSENVRKIREAGTHLGCIISDLLDLSQLEAGKMTLDIQSVNLPEVVSEAINLVTPLVQENGNTLVVELAPDLPPMQTDKLRVRQILVNLLSNAAKFTSGGTITIRGERPNADGGRMLKLSVQDTGDGISEENLSGLFEPYTQFKMNRQCKHAGTGLGLSLSRLLCWAMNGDIQATSELDKGSTFTVYLPLEARSNGKA